MAGSLPDVTVNRMLLDRDGSKLFTVVGTARTEHVAADLTILSNEASDDLGLTTSDDVERYLIAFPELRDVMGLYLGFVQADPADWIDVVVEGSADTTTGLDGDWTELYATSRVQDGATTGWWGHTALGDYRRYIRVVSAAVGLRAIRISVTPQTPSTTAWRLQAAHVFGEITAGQNPHRLALWHPILDQRVPGGHFDWGNAPRQSSADVTFRVKNLSTSRRADAVVLNLDALTDATPSVPAQHLLSYAASAYAATVTIPSIAPGAISKLVTLRRITPSTAAAGPWAARLHAQASTWTETPA